MTEKNGRVVRRHKRRKVDGKGLRLFLADERFRLPAGVSSQEAEIRFTLINRLWEDNESSCRRHTVLSSSGRTSLCGQQSVFGSVFFGFRHH